MREKYLGDSYDIVKRFWAQWLSPIAPLLAHPRFIPTGIRPAFQKITTMGVMEDGERGPFGLFLDPHTGIPSPQTTVQSVSASHAPLSFIQDELHRLSPKYLICFDQSHDRACGLTLRQQRDAKRTFLQERGVDSFYYVSHAPFLFVSADAHVLESLRVRLGDGGIPATRLEGRTIETEEDSR
jgi:hypothetical protein